MPAICCDTKERVLDSLKSRTKELAANLLSPVGKKAIVRDLQPTDVGLETENWSITLTNSGWVNYTTFTVPDWTYIAIGSIFYCASERSTFPITKVRFSTGACVIREFAIQYLGALNETHRVLQSDEQVIFSSGANLTIDVYSTSNTGTVTIGFDGFVGEPAGRSISEPTLVDC